MTDNHENRRNFHRIFFDAPVTVTSGEYTFTCQLADLSLNGALVRKPADWHPVSGENVSVQISLQNHAVNIDMQATVSHIENDMVGLKKGNIDMESISHLRRLVELNLGDSDMLHRDLEHLVNPDI